MSVRRVAVTGVGVVTGYGQGPEALWKGLVSGESAVREHRARFGGKAWLDYPMVSLSDDVATLATALPRQEIVRGEKLADDRDLVVIADCIRQALADARLGYDPDDNRVGLVVTHESPGLSDHLQGFFRWRKTARAWLKSKARFDPPEFLYRLKNESVYRLHSFLYIHYLAALFQLHGFSLYNNNACASGAFALSVAADRIRSGETDAIVVAGGDVPEDGTKFRWFRDAGLYSERGACRPFHADRDGLVLGSGGAAFVLEDLDRAAAAGKRLYAEWLGAGFTSEGWRVTMPDVRGGWYAKAIDAALRSAGVAPAEVSLVAPHGVGSGMLDQFEAESLAAVFGTGGPPWPPLLVGKAALGHTLGGSVLVETAAALLALARSELPEVVRCAAPDPRLPLEAPAAVRLPATDWVMLKCSNGFAGQNGAVVLRAPPSSTE